MIYRILEKSEYPLYDELVQKSRRITIFQTRCYLESLAQKGWTYMLFGAFKDETLFAVFPVQQKKIPFIKRYVYQIPYGVVSSKNVDESMMFNQLRDILVKKAWVIRASLSLDDYQSPDQFRKTGQQETLTIDLSNPLEELIKDFSKTHRNCTRKAAKEGVIVEIRKSVKDVDQFINLYALMTKRKKIEQIDLKFLRVLLKNMMHDKLGFFAIASYEDIIYNIAFISTVSKNARYLYGTSLQTDKKIPPIGQYVHYEIMSYLKTKGFDTYDLGGIPNLPIGEDHPSYFVYKFKKGFGGIHQIMCYDYLYTKYTILEKLMH